MEHTALEICLKVKNCTSGNSTKTKFRYSEISIEWSSSSSSSHTYIIAHYNPSVRIIDLVSHTQVAGPTVLKSKLFMATLRVFTRNLLRGNRQRNISHILF